MILIKLIIILINFLYKINSDPDVSDIQILYTTEAFYTTLLFNQTEWSYKNIQANQLEIVPSLSGYADLLPWMRYFRRKNSSISFIYGTPPINDDGDIDIDIVILNRITFNTTNYRLKYRIINRNQIYKYEVEMKFFDMDIEDFFTNNILKIVKNIFKNNLWNNDNNNDDDDTTNNDSVYITQVSRPIHVGGRFPLDPNEKECVVIRIGSIYNFTKQLYRIESEISQIKNRNTCPKHYIATTVEYLFREHQLNVDWCSFKLINYF